MSEPTAKMTVTLPLEVKERLEGLARTTARSKSLLAADAIASYLDLQEWQISEIRKGLEEAEAGEFASDEEVREVFSKWIDAWTVLTGP